MSFDTLGLPEALARAVADAGYTTPTEVQSRAIPPALGGADLMVSSSTGSGKTASFVLPALTRILAARGDGKRREKGVVSGPRILVLAPTRELAMQVAKATNDYGRHVQGLRVATIVGGVPYGAQLKALRGPLDVLIATPGRLMDHMASGRAVLANVEMLVLDEADRMLDMGFIDDIHHIASATPAARQTVMYSATFAGHVGRLAEELLREPQRIEIASHTDVHADIEQRLHWADNFAHKNALLDHILTERSVEQAVVFTSTQRDADWLADRLAEMGHHVASLHGGHPQGRRNRVLQGLRSRDLKILVATDVAARGIDVPTISHVINFGLPMKAEDYVHRIGRTGRAGRSGLAVTLAERGDAGMIHRIQRFTTQRIPSATIEGLEPKMPEPMREARPPRAGFGGRPQGGKPFHGGGKPFGGKPFAGKSFGGGAPARGPAHERDGERSFAPRAHHDERFAPARPPRGPFDAPARSFGDRAERGAAPGKPFGHGAGKPFGKPFAKPEGKFGGKPAGKFGPKPGPRRPREA
ncbi:DEAD/DEAH box helicase [Rubrivivax benzoatilyticus]|uniref:DEAD/DEAH box helicase n=1 Tax=Rubrivivax benzoatilyticus TaxID=316997 RepID=A0ABX0HT32_9BURK|nr:DEAD/DEAH box helicase [Rubrivivax benzoatilyticus]NHK97435.1 DEAD/DEAH box helicase [Rubrivivax benzoatilyticus]NHL22870.1 DEAD/DEAH box helicase [Rubrivivax benzoatilyticus]